MNRRLSLGSFANRQPQFLARPGSFDSLAEGAIPPAPPQIGVVLMTHNRARAATRLIQALADSLRRANVLNSFLVVVNDSSACDYRPVLEAVSDRFRGSFAFYDSVRWLGKQEFWRMYQHAFDVMGTLRPKLTLFIQDDVTFRPSFVQEMIGLWNVVDDPTTAVLYLCAMKEDEVDGRWIHYARRRMANGLVHLTQWTDLQGFLVSPLFLKVLSHRLFPISPRRWRYDSTRSSGVGEQITLRLFGRANIYQVANTLVFHGGEQSLMNPEVRRNEPFDNRPPLHEPFGWR